MHRIQAAPAGSLCPFGLGSRYLWLHLVARRQVLLQHPPSPTSYLQQPPDQHSGAKSYNFVEGQTSANFNVPLVQGHWNGMQQLRYG